MKKFNKFRIVIIFTILIFNEYPFCNAKIQFNNISGTFGKVLDTIQKKHKLSGEKNNDKGISLSKDKNQPNKNSKFKNLSEVNDPSAQSSYEAHKNLENNNLKSDLDPLEKNELNENIVGFDEGMGIYNDPDNSSSKDLNESIRIKDQEIKNGKIDLNKETKLNIPFDCILNWELDHNDNSKYHVFLDPASKNTLVNKPELLLILKKGIESAELYYKTGKIIEDINNGVDPNHSLVFLKSVGYIIKPKEIIKLDRIEINIDIAYNCEILEFNRIKYLRLVKNPRAMESPFSIDNTFLLPFYKIKFMEKQKKIFIIRKFIGNEPFICLSRNRLIYPIHINNSKLIILRHEKYTDKYMPIKNLNQNFINIMRFLIEKKLMRGLIISKEAHNYFKKFESYQLNIKNNLFYKITVVPANKLVYKSELKIPSIPDQYNILFINDFYDNFSIIDDRLKKIINNSNNLLGKSVFLFPSIRSYEKPLIYFFKPNFLISQRGSNFLRSPTFIIKPDQNIFLVYNNSLYNFKLNFSSSKKYLIVDLISLFNEFSLIFPAKDEIIKQENLFEKKIKAILIKGSLKDRKDISIYITDQLNTLDKLKIEEKPLKILNYNMKMEIISSPEELNKKITLDKKLLNFLKLIETKYGIKILNEEK